MSQLHQEKLILALQIIIWLKLLPPKKCRRDRSSSYTPTLPQEFKIGESSRKTSLERHEEQIEDILNHLDELSLDRIENMEDNIEGLRKGRVIIKHDFDNLETEPQETRAQVAKLQRKQLGQNNKIDLARFRITDLKQIIKEIQARHQADKESSKGVFGLIRWFERTELVFSHSNCTEYCKVKFPTGTLTEEALSWWNSFTQPIGIEEAYKITWVEFKKLVIKKYCPRTEVQNMEDEFYHLTVKRNDLKTYVRRFHELETLCPTMVSNSEKIMEAFIEGLPRRQNRIKTRQKLEAWRRREKSEAVTVDRGRKTEENTKRRARNANTCKVIQALKERKKRKGLKLHFHERYKWGTKTAKDPKWYTQGLSMQITIITWRAKVTNPETIKQERINKVKGRNRFTLVMDLDEGHLHSLKLNRGLKESNYDQLYAYLKQHEAHDNENKMMLECFTQHTVDPLALMSNVSPQHYSLQSSTTPPSTHVSPVTYQPYFADNTQLDSGHSPTDNFIENLTNTLSLLT
nr:reverse transcriptase domain-containing protein [Tanacetum cinerariifolium]